MKFNKKIDCKRIKLIISDFDGVLTDNRVLVDEDGREAVFVNRSDGLAVGMLRKAVESSSRSYEDIMRYIRGGSKK